MSEGSNTAAMRSRTLLQRIAEPWTIVVLVTALFHFFRGAPVDGSFFLVVTALLFADAVDWVRIPVPTLRLPRLATLLGLAVVLGTLLILAPRHGIVEGLILSAIGVSVLAFAWESGGKRAENSRALRKSLVLFTAVVVIGCLIEVSSYLLGLPSSQAMFEHPSISLLLDPFIGSLPGRVIFTSLWLASGIWLLRRARERKGV